jgi:hypothetical protein
MSRDNNSLLVVNLNTPSNLPRLLQEKRVLIRSRSKLVLADLKYPDPENSPLGGLKNLLHIGNKKTDRPNTGISQYSASLV